MLTRNEGNWGAQRSWRIVKGHYKSVKVIKDPLYKCYDYFGD